MWRLGPYTGSVKHKHTDGEVSPEYNQIICTSASSTCTLKSRRIHWEQRWWIMKPPQAPQTTVSLSGVRTLCFWRLSGLGKGVTLLAQRCRCCCWPCGVHSQKHRCSRSCAGISQSSPRVLKVKLNHLHHGGGVSHQFICRKLVSSNSTFKIRAWGFSRDVVLPRWMKVNPGCPQREVCEFQTVLQLSRDGISDHRTQNGSKPYQWLSYDAFIHRWAVIF